MTLKKKLKTSFFWVGIEQVGIQAISFIISIILARILLPSDFGIIGMILIFIAIGKSLTDSGLSLSLVRSKELGTVDYSTVFYFNLLGSVFIYLLVFFAAPFISAFYNEEILIDIIRVYSFVFIINALGNIQQIRIIKHLAFKLLFKISIPSIILGGFVGIYMAYAGYGVWSLVVSALVQASINTLLLWLFGKWMPTFQFEWNIFKKHFYYGYKLTLAGLIETFYKNSYTVIIGRVFGTSQLGYFTRADTLKQVPVQNIGTILNKVTFPLFSSIQDDDKKLKSAYKSIMQVVIFFVAPLLLIASALAEPLIRFLLTEKWLPSVPYFQILCWAGILFPLNAYNLNILKIKGRSDLFLKLEVVKKTIGVLTILVTFQFGIIALLWGGVIVSAFSFFINSYYTGRFISYSSFEQLKDIIPLVFLAALVAGFSWYLDQNVQNYFSSDFMRLLIWGSTGVLIYLLLVKLFLNRILLKMRSLIFEK